MTVLELCEPLFKKVCLLNRVGREGASLSSAIELEKLRLEIKELFADLEKKASSQPGLGALWQKLELPLIFFADSMIAECGLAVSTAWHHNRLAYERKELAGDEKFFDLLDETLNDPSEADRRSNDQPQRDFTRAAQSASAARRRRRCAGFTDATTLHDPAYGSVRTSTALGSQYVSLRP